MKHFLSLSCLLISLLPFTTITIFFLPFLTIDALEPLDYARPPILALTITELRNLTPKFIIVNVVSKALKIAHMVVPTLRLFDTRTETFPSIVKFLSFI